MSQSKTESKDSNSPTAKFLRIEKLAPRKLVGKSLEMSMVDNKTAELWKSFMPHRNKIQNTVGNDLYSIQEYPVALSLEHFDPTIAFKKYALSEVSAYGNLPEGMQPYELKGGMYAVFLHMGLPAQFPATINFIFAEWLPNADYVLDHRPHFEVLGDKYSNTNPSSQEEVWIPVKKKS
ncbi:GyrI-like domain-containing protein [Nonlabens ponticola]|uniref:AraC family transcriptional regulator n=1 Tax=Nonlabens ponticola TaxID=2496866 RepID=A0A3S9MXS9_9FLAO|nr:GyrI-like domain-containing protein [Nonlabens ponticola]AZQ43944.1 AraC family transcriptional regulator [Nonlabens ponticola]